jgi:hypothetical protein
VALQELLRFILVVRDLQDVRELRLILARLQVAVDAADPGHQEQNADDDAENGGAHDESGRPHRVRGQGHLIGMPVMLLLQEEAVEVRIDGLIGGHEPGSERRVRMTRHARRAEQVTYGGPLAGELLDIGALGWRIVRVELLEVDELRFDRGENGGVERAEEPGLPGSRGGEERPLARGVRRIHVLGELAGCVRGGQLVARGGASQARCPKSSQYADGRDGDDNEREPHEQRPERAARGSGEHSHLSLPTQQGSI